MGIMASFRKKQFVYLSVGVFAAMGALIMSNQFSESQGDLQQAVAPKDLDIVAPATSQPNIVCWQKIDALNMIVCATNTAFCFEGWNEGSPYPQQCSITFP